MRRRTLIRAMCMFIGLIVLPQTALAQEDTSVIILEFERFDADGDIVGALKRELQEGIEAHDEMNVKPGGEMTIKDLAVSAGCEEPDVACMKTLRDFLDADRVVFGSVQRSDDVYLFSMKMFDFGEGRFVTELDDQTVQGSAVKVKQVLPAVVESFLYGDVGTLVVQTSGADSPEIVFDGQKIGVAPTTLENLPLGEHVITVKTAAGEEETRTVVLRYQEPVTLNFAFGAAEAPDGAVDADGAPSAVPGWVSIGVGVVGLGVGIYASAQVQAAPRKEEEFADEFLVPAGEGHAFRSEAVAEGESSALALSDALSDIQRRGETYEVVQWVGYGVGAAGLVVGGILLVRSMSGGEVAPQESAALPFDFQIAPTREGVAASLRLRF